MTLLKLPKIQGNLYLRIRRNPQSMENGSQWINIPASQLPGGLLWKAFSVSGPHESKPLLQTTTLIKCPLVCHSALPFFLSVILAASQFNYESSKSLSWVVLCGKRVLYYCLFWGGICCHSKCCHLLNTYHAKLSIYLAQMSAQLFMALKVFVWI